MVGPICVSIAEESKTHEDQYISLVGREFQTLQMWHVPMFVPRLDRFSRYATRAKLSGQFEVRGYSPVSSSIGQDRARQKSARSGAATKIEPANAHNVSLLQEDGTGWITRPSYRANQSIYNVIDDLARTAYQRHWKHDPVMNEFSISRAESILETRGEDYESEKVSII